MGILPADYGWIGRAAGALKIKAASPPFINIEHGTARSTELSDYLRHSPPASSSFSSICAVHSTRLTSFSFFSVSASVL